jgi:flagellar hook-basal body complex protein FliE
MMQWALEPLAAPAQAGWAAAAATPLEASLAMPSAGTPPGPSGPVAFADLLYGDAGSVNGDIQAAEAAMRDLAAGRPVELHEVMITLERARLSVQTFVHVRNKLIESYQDLMRMQL